MRLSFIKILILLCASLVFAKAVPPQPRNSYVYDENRLLSAQETRTFNIIAQELFDKTGVGIAAAIFQDIDGEDYRDFAHSIAESWKIGSKDKDGILIFVTLNEKRRSVETGYNVESIIPDALAERIQQQTLVPQFRVGKYAEGIISLEFALSQKIAEHYNVKLNLKENQQIQEKQGHLSPFHFILLMLLLAFLLGTPIGRQILLYSLLSGMMRSGGGGSGRGNGRGGFGGGFGGGSFGGGGSGGSW